MRYFICWLASFSSVIKNIWPEVPCLPVVYIRDDKLLAWMNSTPGCYLAQTHGGGFLTGWQHLKMGRFWPKHTRLSGTLDVATQMPTVREEKRQEPRAAVPRCGAGAPQLVAYLAPCRLSPPLRRNVIALCFSHSGKKLKVLYLSLFQKRKNEIKNSLRKLRESVYLPKTKILKCSICVNLITLSVCVI